MINTINTCRENTLESPRNIRGEFPANLSKIVSAPQGEEELPATKMAAATHVGRLWVTVQCMGHAEILLRRRYVEVRTRRRAAGRLGGNLGLGSIEGTLVTRLLRS